MKVLMIGTLQSGFTFVGPFACDDAIQEHIERRIDAEREGPVATGNELPRQTFERFDLMQPAEDLQRDGVEDEPRPSDIVCANCGSRDVLVARWADPNTGETAQHDGPDDTRCDNCENDGDPGVCRWDEFEKKNLSASDPASEEDNGC